MQGMKISMEMDVKMSNINNVTDIVVPEEELKNEGAVFILFFI